MSSRYQTIEELLDENSRTREHEKKSRPYCSCGFALYEEVNPCTENEMVVEYDMKCTNCDKIFGHWAYGAYFDEHSKLF